MCINLSAFVSYFLAFALDDLVLKADRKVEYIGMEHAAMETRHHRGGGNAIVFKEEKNDA